MERTDTLPERIGPLQVLRLAWPILVSMLSFTAMIVVDSIFVGQLGTAPLAALGIAAPAVFLLFAFGLGLIRGVKVVVSQRVGAGDDVAGERALWQMLALAVGIGLALALLAPFGRPLFVAMGATPEVIAFAVPYYAVRALGAPLTLLRHGVAAWLEGQGDMRTPMVATLIANGLNILLDPVFIFGWGPVPGMETAGAAIATVLAVAVGDLYLAWRVARREGPAISRRPDRRLLASIWRVGSPMGTRQLLEVGAWTVFVSLLARVGEEHLAAHVVVLRIVSVSFLPGYAVGEAGSVLVGQALGARRPELAEQAWRASVRLAVTVMVACAGVFLAIPEALLAPFGVSGEVVVLGRELLVVAAVFQLFDAVAMVGQSVLTGAGDTRFVLASAVASAWLFKLPATWVLAIELGLGRRGPGWR
jgi:MATE family multidrug resistance protein